MNLTANLILTFLLLFTVKEYPFEKYPSPTYQEFNDWTFYDWTDTKGTVNHTITLPDFFPNSDTLTVQLTSTAEEFDALSTIRIFRNRTQIQKVSEPWFFSPAVIGIEPLLVADLNGDGLSDLKLILPTLGNGLASMNCRVIYLFQKSDNRFDKVSYLDKFMNGNRPERDIDGDGNYEIITMTLNGVNNHNYWTFQFYNYTSEGLVNSNRKDDYPIMIQFLHVENHTITDHFDRNKMKEFETDLPKEYDFKETTIANSH